MNRIPGFRAAAMVLMALGLGGCRSSRAPVAEAPAITTRPASVDLEGARAAFYQAVGGDQDALRRATESFGRAHEARPDSAVATAYLGACRLLAAAAATWPWEKGRLAKEGAGLLDQAVGAAPGDLEVRFVRGMTNYRLPKFMGRSSIAEEDLAIVAGQASQAVREGRLAAALGAAALYHHGLLLEGKGDKAGAIEAWREAVTIAPEAPGGMAAAKRLGKIARPN